MARTISDQDRARAKAMMKKKINGSSRTISDADRARAAAEAMYMKRNDSGMAKKTRVF